MAAEQDQPMVHGSAELRQQLAEWCRNHGLPVYNLHAFRHGYAHNAIQRCRTMADLQWVSLNLLHSSLVVTSGIYARFLDEERPDLFSQIATHFSQPAQTVSETPAATALLNANLNYQALSIRQRKHVDRLMESLMMEDAQDE